MGTRRETSKVAGDCPVCTEPLDPTGGDGFFMPPCGNSDHAPCMRCAYKMYPDQPIRCTVCRAGVLHPQRLLKKIESGSKKKNFKKIKQKKERRIHRRKGREGRDITLYPLPFCVSTAGIC